MVRIICRGSPMVSVECGGSADAGCGGRGGYIPWLAVGVPPVAGAGRGGGPGVAQGVA